MSALLVLCCLVSAQVVSQANVQPEPDEHYVTRASSGLHFDLDASTAEEAPNNAAALLVMQDSTSARSPLARNATDLGSPSAEAEADAPVQSPANYSARLFLRQTASVPWRLGGAAAVITASGVANWNWGSSSFHFKSEGWFGRKTHSLGMDKLGHAYSSYVLTEFFTDGIGASGSHPRTKSYTAGILAMGLMTYIEVFDGLSKDHGFSPEDLAVDLAGTLFSVARRSIPGMREKVDFRLLYKPSKSTFSALSCFPSPHCNKDGAPVRGPITDYSHQRYLLAFKLAGFGRLRETPLRLAEVHAGYYARGFTKEEKDRGDPLRRRFFAGVGLNIGELLFPRRASPFARAARSVLEWVQIPYTAVHSN